MLKIYVIADESWYPKYSMDRFQQHATKLSFVSSPEEANLIWHYSYYLSDPSISANIFKPLEKFFRIRERKKRKLRMTPFVGSVHHLASEKRYYWQDSIKRLDNQADFIHYFSNNNLEKDRDIFRKPVFWAPYWIDLQMFRPFDSEARRHAKARLGLPTNRCILGSFQRDTEADGVSPKIEKGPDLFADVIGGLDPSKIFVLLAGPRRSYLEERIKQAKIEYRSMGEVDHSSMPELYGAIDRYLVTSRTDGGPQAILECMATMTPIYSTSVGASDLLEPDALKHTVNDFILGIKQAYPGILNKHLENIKRYSCGRVVPYYEKLFSEIVSNFVSGQIDQSIALSKFPQYENFRQ